MFVRQGPNTVDAALSISTPFAAAGASATSNALDLGQGSNVTPRLELEINLPALPPLVAGETLNLKVQDSADGNTFADLFLLPPINGAVGGTAATSARYGLGSTTRQYVAVVATEANGGGVLTGFQFEFHPVFFRGV